MNEKISICGGRGKVETKKEKREGGKRKEKEQEKDTAKERVRKRRFRTEKREREEECKRVKPCVVSFCSGRTSFTIFIRVLSFE